MTLTYCPGPLRAGCPDNALVPQQQLCAACQVNVGSATEQRGREVARLRKAGFALTVELEGVPHWRNADGRTFTHGEALAQLKRR